MADFFGTDGIRGKIGFELTPELAFKTGQALGEILKKKKEHPKVLIGKDTRSSGDMIELSLASGLTSVGSDVILLSVVPTPAVAYLTIKYEGDAGVMISASHNPACDNGIKIFAGDGFKLSDEEELEIEEYILGKKTAKLADEESIGGYTISEKAIEEYISYTKSTVNNIDNLKILIDCSNGSAVATAKKMFTGFNIHTDFINDKPNGLNINEKSGSTNIHLLKNKVLEGKYDVAIAFDGDADRVLFLDEKGKEVDGDYILAFLTSSNKIFVNNNKKTIVGTVMTNMGLYKFCEENGIGLRITGVGDRYVLDEMVKHNLNLGGEQSGHIILRKYQTTGDGQLTALLVLELLCESKTTMSAICNVINKFPQKLINLKIDNDKKDIIMNDEEILKETIYWEKELTGVGRVLIRPSGTEPLIRIMVEAESEKDLNRCTNDLEKIFKRKIASLE